MKRFNIRWQLVLYDLLILVGVELVMLGLYRGIEALDFVEILQQISITLACVFTARLIGAVYKQIWRYGGIQCYIRLLFVDTFAFWANFVLERIMPLSHVSFARLLSVACINLLCSLAIRMVYRYAYKCVDMSGRNGRMLGLLLRIFAGSEIRKQVSDEHRKIKVAIIGAGRVGVSLAEELLNNTSTIYTPRCFVDIQQKKADRSIMGLPVLLEDETIFEVLREMEIQEVVFAMPNLEEEYKKHLYDSYSGAGYRVKVYDYPVMQTTEEKRKLRSFDAEELLFRKPVIVEDQKTNAYYRNKVILITGGGGSIGSELCRQLARMEPGQIIIFDIYENGAYDIQQELKLAYGGKLDIRVEIASICNKKALTRVFDAYRPQIVINAAAHKHVPLMEKNCIEAVENNVFGTVNLVDRCEEYGTERFMMVSTDKAVNPTNVMGATKRMCEMIVKSASTLGKVKYSSTRFGNVLGSAGSVIPLFKKQIAAGGPITLTDKRIIRYFMTIPEASQLVLQSGAMADNGDLFVLDMGRPVKILDLAQNLIKLSGAEGIEIIETGLREGEKLYEELLINTGELDKTENSLIFIERDKALSKEDIHKKLRLLEEACESGDDDIVKSALKIAVPTFKSPEEVNALAEKSREMKEERVTV